MNIRNSITGDRYFIDLFEKWWHFPLLGLTWFLPHKAYLVTGKENSKPGNAKFGVGVGVATGFGFILSDLIKNLGIMGIPVELHWIGKILAYPLSVLLVFIFYKWTINKIKERNRVNFYKSYSVHMNIFSYKIFRKCIFPLITSFAFIVILSESLVLDIFGMLIVILVSIVIIVLFTISIGVKVNVVSIEGEKLVVE